MKNRDFITSITLLLVLLSEPIVLSHRPDLAQDQRTYPVGLQKFLFLTDNVGQAYTHIGLAV